MCGPKPYVQGDQTPLVHWPGFSKEGNSILMPCFSPYTIFILDFRGGVIFLVVQQLWVAAQFSNGCFCIKIIKYDWFNLFISTHTVNGKNLSISALHLQTFHPVVHCKIWSRVQGVHRTILGFTPSYIFQFSLQ